ncbi:MAG: serine/threonine-protein kinase [Candidatus Rickettsiella isopodorum]
MYRHKKKPYLTLSDLTQQSGTEDPTSWVSEQNIAIIRHGKLYLPDNTAPTALVQKKEKKSTASEIKIYRLIASNKQSEKKSILQPIFNRLKGSFLFFPLISGGNLDLSQYFLFEQFKEKRIIAASWLMKQLFLLLEALHHLHTETFVLEGRVFKGIIHGDIKPSNILINELGNLVLADFDCAYPAAEPACQLGSLRYMAPELFSNLNFTLTPFLNIDKSDIWSLGITLYRLLNNKFPNFFRSFNYNQKNSAHHFFQEKIFDKNTPCILFEDNISSFIDLKQWGENYSSSFIAKKARESLKILQHHKEKNIAHLTLSDILSHLSTAMLGSIDDRPNTKELLTLMHALQKHFSPFNDKESQEFINELLSHSSLNTETCVNKNLNPSGAKLKNKTRSFS